MNILFVTGNKKKAEYLSKYLECNIDHKKLDLDEIQSTDIYEVVEHKVKQAYELVKRPVLIEDVSLEFGQLNGLPGPLIKWFVDKVNFQDICNMVGEDRSAVARCVFAYYDGEVIEYFEGSLNGSIAKSPSEDNGFGWDSIFIAEGCEITRAQLNEKDYKETYFKLRPLNQIKDFIDQL